MSMLELSVVYAGCVCQNGYGGPYCEINLFSPSSTTSWQLLGLGTPALSLTGHKVALVRSTAYIYGGYDYTSAHHQLYRSVTHAILNICIPLPSFSYGLLQMEKEIINRKHYVYSGNSFSLLCI